MGVLRRPTGRLNECVITVEHKDTCVELRFNLGLTSAGTDIYYGYLSHMTYDREVNKQDIKF